MTVDPRPAEALDPHAAELYQIAHDLGLTSTKAIIRGPDGQITGFEERQIDPAALIVKGRDLVKGLQARGEKIPPGLASVQWFDAAACFLKAAAPHLSDPIKQADWLAAGAYMDGLVAKGVRDGIEYVPQVVLTGWIN
jgi:hypothetical protein